jgi:molybdopterin converting factor small subunit
VSIRIKMARLLMECTKSPSVVYASGSTVGECLNNVLEKYPQAQKCFFDRRGGLIINISVNKQEFISHKDKLDLAVKEGDEIYLLSVVGGG